MNNLKIANEVAVDIAKIRVVDIRCTEPDTAKIFSNHLRLLLPPASPDGTAEVVERYG